MIPQERTGLGNPRQWSAMDIKKATGCDAYTDGLLIGVYGVCVYFGFDDCDDAT